MSSNPCGSESASEWSTHLYKGSGVHGRWQTGNSMTTTRWLLRKIPTIYVFRNITNLHPYPFTNPANIQQWKVRRDYTLQMRSALLTWHWDMVPEVNVIHYNFRQMPARELTPSTAAVPNCCCSKASAPYWSNPPFLIFDIRALWRSVLSARAPECQKLKMVG